jgi:hypothetical protein
MRNQTGTSGRGDGVPSGLQEGDELRRIIGRRQAGLAGADYGERFTGWQMGESFL